MDFYQKYFVKHHRYPSKLFSDILSEKKKKKKFSDTSLARLGKNMSIAMKNLTKS